MYLNYYSRYGIDWILIQSHSVKKQDFSRTFIVTKLLKVKLYAFIVIEMGRVYKILRPIILIIDNNSQ